MYKRVSDKLDLCFLSKGVISPDSLWLFSVSLIKPECPGSTQLLDLTSFQISFSKLNIHYLKTPGIFPLICLVICLPFL